MPPGAQGQNTIHRKPVETCLVPVCVVLPSLLGVFFFLWPAVCCAPLYSSRVVLRDVLLAGAQSVRLPIPPRPREEWNWVDILKVAELEPLCDMPCPSFFCVSICEHAWRTFFIIQNQKNGELFGPPQLSAAERTSTYAPSIIPRYSQMQRCTTFFRQLSSQKPEKIQVIPNFIPNFIPNHQKHGWSSFPLVT